MQATSKEGKDGGIELIQPPANSKPGDRVYFEGEDYESKKYASCLRLCNLIFIFLDTTPLAQLNPKKKIFEAIQPGAMICILAFFVINGYLQALLHLTRERLHGSIHRRRPCIGSVQKMVYVLPQL